MIDPLTTAVLTYFVGDGTKKLLGPTFEYWGGGLKNFAKDKVTPQFKNLFTIFKLAEKKLGDKIEEPGVVPPKVLKTITNYGAYCTDEIAREYFGGVLASSRTKDGKDDRGARISKLIDRLTIYQIRLHFLIYCTIKNLFSGKGLSVGTSKDRVKLKVFIPPCDFKQCMALDEREIQILQTLLPHSFFGLESESLISNFEYGSKEHLLTFNDNIHSEGIVFTPSNPGIELFLYAFNKADKNHEYIFDPSFLYVVEKKDIPNGFPNAMGLKI